jgi:hypothetical protein
MQAFAGYFEEGVYLGYRLFVGLVFAFGLMGCDDGSDSTDLSESSANLQGADAPKGDGEPSGEGDGEPNGDGDGNGEGIGDGEPNSESGCECPNL